MSTISAEGRCDLKGLFVTGTDTGVGKTLVAAGLLRAMRNTGMDVLPCKPVQTGCTFEYGNLLPPDLELCLKSSDLHPSKEIEKLMCPFRYRPACSPHLAGRMAGKSPTIASIADSLNKLSDGCEYVIVEGAGGVMVPLNNEETMLDLMTGLGLPVLLVARAGLGTINHSLLSILALESRNVQPAGIVMNMLREKTSYITDDNSKTVERFSGVPVLSVLPSLPGDNPEETPVFRRAMERLAGLILEEM
ncbi:MAG: dethiobiotin synthase [Candidatus Aegiribacteria sp.]|nr:dethiobiotin synthase [Candidatus Aegiribacteria sp.]MBD3294018.1 dethiobiotin synthase [Candidatus Fermentibacteria bacterium]